MILDSGRVSDYCLTENDQFVHYGMARTSYIRWADIDARLVRFL